MKTLIAIPCMETVPVDFVTSFANIEPIGEVEPYFLKGSLVYDSRNRLCQKAIDEGFDYVLWLDSDMTFQPDILKRLMKDIKGKDIVCGLFFTRKPKYKPCIYSRCSYELDIDTGMLTPIAESFEDYPKNAVFKVDACGFGAVLVRTSAMAKISQKKGLPFNPIQGFGEDLSFCLKAKECGFDIWCDSSVKVGHIGYVAIDETYVERANNDTV